MVKWGNIRGIVAVALATAVLFAGIAYHERSNRDVAALVAQTGANLIYVSFPQPVPPATLGKIEKLPGITAAAGQGTTSYFYAPGTKYSIGWMLVSSNYVPTMGLRLVEGHNFASDNLDGVILGWEVKEAVFGQASAVGKSLDDRRVIGVLAPIPSDDIVRQSLNRVVLTTVLPSHPGLESASGYDLVYVRAGGAVLLAVKSLSSAFPDARILPIEKLYSFSVGLARILNKALLTAALGLLFLASVLLGILLTLSVQRRIREIGIRRAVGATPRDIRAQIAREGLTTVWIGGGIGITIGIMFTIVSAPATAFSWLHLAILPSVSLAVLPGVLLPAVRASRISPVEALRRRTLLSCRHRLDFVWILIGAGLTLGFLFVFVVDSTSGAIRDYIHWSYGNLDARTLIVRAPRKSILLGPDLTAQDRDLIAGVSGVQSVIPVFSQMIETGITAAAIGEEIIKLGFPPVVEGRVLTAADFDDQAAVCEVSESFVKNKGLDAPVGTAINVKGTAFKIVGVFRDTYIRAEFPIDILIPAGHSGILPIAQVWFLVHVSPRADPAEVKEGIVATLAKKYPHRAKVEVVSAIGRQAKFVTFFKQGEIRMSMTAVAALLFATGEAIALIQFLLERRRQELGIKRAVGATPRLIVLSVVEEAAALSGVAAGIAVLLGSVLSPMFIGWFILLKSPPWWTPAPFVAALAAIVAAISALPVARVYRIPPAELIEEGRE